MRERIAALILCLFYGTVYAEDVLLKQGAGAVNWTTGIVTATGVTEIPDGLINNASAKRALTNKAKLMAYRNLAEMVAGIRITSTTTVENMMLTSDSVTAKVDALIRGAKIINTEDNGDLISVTLAFDTNTGFVQAILPEEYTLAIPNRRLENNKAFMAAMWSKLNGITFWPQVYADEVDSMATINTVEELMYAKRLYSWLLKYDKDLALALMENIETFEKQNLFTGILIDARDITDFELAVIPTIRNLNGEKIYPGEIYSFSDGRMKRPVSYDFSMKDAWKNKRIASHPLEIKALHTYENRKSDLVISNAAAELLISNEHIKGVVKRASVMVVIAN